MSCLNCMGPEIFFQPLGKGKCQQCGYDRRWSQDTRVLYMKLGFATRTHAGQTFTQPIQNTHPRTTEELNALVAAEDQESG